MVTRNPDPSLSSEDATYRPHTRTALVLSGTGTAGAYQAGVLRALHEAGVKIDVIAAHGIGAGTALLAAIDGAARLWEPDGIWRNRRIKYFYTWRRAATAAFFAFMAGCLIIVLPLVGVVAGLLVYPVAFLAALISPDLGLRLQSAYVGLVDRAFQPDMLPTLVPRLALLTVATVVAILAGTALREFLARGDRRRDRGPWWARVLGSPWTSQNVVDLFAETLWQFLRGASRLKQPTTRDLSRRYAEVLNDNLGQPGFRELILTSHDLDARQDVIFGLVAEPHRRVFFRHGPSGLRRRAGEVLDLAAIGRDYVLDAVAGCLTLPVFTEPHSIVFPLESYWRGETHRLTDRSGAAVRLLDEVAAAGVRQVVVVSSIAERDSPYELVGRSLELRSRMEDYLEAADAAASRDAINSRAPLFESIFQIRPAHNPLGALAFDDCRDERSDRTFTVAELIDRGYEDAYRQFIDPIVGASGERLSVRT